MLILTSRTAHQHRPNRPFAPARASGIPFNTAEEAWFWFICAVQAREDGANPGKGRGEIPRPCEPTDILRTLERLYRNRRLLWPHIKVLNHYGRRHTPPEEQRPLEVKASKLWREAMKELDVVLQRRGIVHDIFQREFSKMKGMETL